MVEFLPSKQVVAGSSPVSRSIDSKTWASEREAQLFYPPGRFRGLQEAQDTEGLHATLNQ